ncbi:MAG: prepilin-type N-terminal cleavage/methylation domain-containing protein [Alteraurantiacibacter sp.]
MTLVEMLVVLAIIGITASIAVLSLGSNRGIDMRAAAMRMQAQIQLAADETMISDRQMAIQMGAHGYSFVERPNPASDWQPSQVPQLSEEFVLPTGMDLHVSQAIIPIGASGAGRPFTIRLEGETGRWIIAFDGMTARIAPGEGDRAAELMADSAP